MKKKSAVSRIRMLARRAASGLMALVLVCGLLPAVTQPVRAEDWAQEYLDKLVEWDIMRGDIDGNLYSERNITRAEFVTLINRAYGYEELGRTPFIDVDSTAWYAEDISIAYNVGYFTGTSANTAEPDLNLSREQAALVMGRNMMLQPTTGEVLGFPDSRDFSEWSRDMIQSVALAGVITGYPDGTFGPQNNITRGEMACMLVKAIGTPIRESGEYTLGNVYGNVTISTSGVTLRNTTVAGDLYLTGGIALGDVLLENVTVLGRIVASGAGESNMGENSIILRNVAANEMVVDSIDNQFVTVRSEGDTAIDNVSVRTPAYLEDVAPSGQGLRVIQLDGETGNSLYLAGNIKEVINLTPNSNLVIAQGAAEKVTVDEKAVSSTLNIDGSARVKELNLDVGTSVTGTGDIDALIVNAAGSTVASLPDSITIRPGITATINGKTMDSTAASESSADPRLLAGYPAAKDVAPTTATVVFSTNKAGTVYWAISALADGSVSEDDVISPPTYASTILKSGNIKVTSSKTEYTAKVTGLTSDGSYYLTAVLVDDRGQHSPVKVTAFTTPDDSVPNFATGYPVMTRITNDSAQVTVMPTKSCLLYYALLPKGSTAPKAQDFKSNAITGNLGYGSLDVIKNSTLPFTVNNISLDELATYDLYLWLTDYDGAKSSAVKKLTFTTVDGTPPIVRYMEQTDAKATSVEMTYALSEPGTLYWAIVKEGESFFRPLTGSTTIPELSDEAAKTQVEAGLGAVRKGSSSASKADTDIKLTISGLAAQTSYDLYYVAKDKAGNYSDTVVKITVSSLDNMPPTATQEFTKYNGNETNSPLPDSDIRLVFNESIWGMETQGGKPVYDKFKELYEAVQFPEENGVTLEQARNNLATALSKHIKLYNVPSYGQPVQVQERNANNEDTVGSSWVIDYRYASILMEDGKMIVLFPTTDDDASSRSALNLASGATYYFRLEGITDTAIVPNIMGNTNLPQFRTVFAQVALSMGNEWELNTDDETGVRVDMDFLVDPIAVSRVDPDMLWDMLIWTDTSMTYTLYSREVGGDEDSWVKEGSTTINVTGAPDGFAFRSLVRYFRTESGKQPVFEPLREMEQREFAIRVDRIGDSDEYTAWNQRVTMRVMIVSAAQFGLNSLSSGSYNTDWQTAQLDNGATSIGLPDPFEIKKPFTDQAPPEFIDNHPIIRAGDIAAEVDVMIDRPGQVYYVAVPLTNLTDENGKSVEFPSNITAAELEAAINSITNYNCAVLPTISGTTNDKPLPKDVPTSGADTPVKLSSPGVSTITSGRFTGDVRYGNSISMEARNASTIRIENLNPNTLYYLYLVTKGTSAIYSDEATCYLFKTEEAVRPAINLSGSQSSVDVWVDRDTDLDYILVLSGQEDPYFKASFNSNYIISGTTLDTEYTVLEAMATPYYEGGEYKGSIFDQYATQSAKELFAGLIRSQEVTGTDVVMKGSDSFALSNNSTTRNRINCTGMIGTNYYTLLAVGSSTMGSGDAFRAIYPVTQRDTTPPVVTNAIIAVTEWDGNKIKDGYITLVFNEGLYARSQGTTSQTILPVDNCKLLASGHPADKYIAVGGLVTTTEASGVTVVGDDSHSESTVTQTAPISTIVLNISNAGNGFGVSFRTNICDSSGNNRENSPLTVTVVVKQVGTDDSGAPIYEASLTLPNAWDGRE